MSSTDFAQRYQEELGSAHMKRVNNAPERRNPETEIDELKKRVAKLEKLMIAAEGGKKK